MTLGGWISMTVTIGFVLALFSWCCYKMTTAPQPTEDDGDANEELDANSGANAEKSA